MKPLAVFYHSWYHPQAFGIIREALGVMAESSLQEAASHIQLNFNGTPDGQIQFPAKMIVLEHPPESQNESMTIVEVEKFAKAHPDWYVLYFHSKGSRHTHQPEHDKLMGGWRRCMTEHCVRQWRKCVQDLDDGFEAVGTHWLKPDGPDGTGNFHIFGGNFWWTTTNFINAEIPSIYVRHSQRTGHLGDHDLNGFEAEVWIGQARRIPKVKDYHPGWPGVHG